MKNVKEFRIASVVRQDDSFDLHADDTLKAGDGLCDFKAVEMLVKEAPGCVDRLQNLGMIFDQSSDQLSTTLEAAHSRRRVLHVKDRTGRALVEVLEAVSYTHLTLPTTVIV